MSELIFRSVLSCVMEVSVRNGVGNHFWGVRSTEEDSIWGDVSPLPKLNSQTPVSDTINELAEYLKSSNCVFTSAYVVKN